ncbi:2-hydroxyacid dehydrogenase [Jhaorihella thermophila]|uniref:Glyoxylate/hydroxypyruvate reductase A n=1 Tax=Jhaorihella thermophila TaxID=488547 RepID=A0A1H5RUN2_9RHOB|nr:glyoxylate/hydroxypyruvate reductase A [Jhaorihella thermophila]SEF41970.1 glyoxylate/hydroxypyruvate reductase A [Jhaorihella thermophila]
MPINVLFAAAEADWPTYREPLTRAFAEAGLDCALARDLPPDQVDYIVYAPSSAVQDFSPFTRLRAVLSLWAGVERIVGNDTLRVPLARMVDHGLTQGMTEWVVGHVLRHHLGMDSHITGQDGTWRKSVPPLARDRSVAMLGLGALGQAAARALAGLGFDVTGWSRTAKSLDGLKTDHGAEGLARVLRRAEIVVLLLPDTPQTRNILDADTLSLLPRGAIVINPGRGTLIDDDALLAALDRGQIGHATLDVFRTEPLPAEHPYWSHPRVTVTPHIAAETRPDSAARVIAENIRRGEAGEPLLHLVDRTRGY